MSLQFGHRAVSKYDGSTPEAWRQFTCGHCGNKASGVVIAASLESTTGRTHARWLQCPTCLKPSAEWESSVYPGASFGPVLEGLPNDVEAAYEEARRCFSSNAFTAVELVCRKILMHVACDKGAKEGQTFASYLDNLEKQGYITPPMRDWVKLIKDHGNDSTHKLAPPDSGRAAGTLLFTVQLLRTVYEMSHIAGKFTSPPKQ